jgi:hypothetical protein
MTIRKSHAEMHEGPDAFDRFKKAMRTIVSVPQSRRRPAEESTRQGKTRREGSVIAGQFSEFSSAINRQ